MKKIWLIFISSLLVLFIFSTTVLATDGLELYLKGLTSYYKNDFEQATDLFTQALKLDNNSDLKIDIMYYQTLSYIESNNIITAKEKIKKLNEMGYEFGILHWELGKVYLNKEGQFDSPFYSEAKKQLEKANILGISSANFHRDLALAYQGLGDIDQAASEYERALKNGGKAGDYLNIASLYKDNGQSQKAIEYYNKALDLDPKITSAYLNLGTIYLDKKNYKKAVNILKKGTNLQPSFVALRYRLGKAYYLNGNLNEAEHVFNKVVELNKNTYRAYYYLGEIYTDKQKWQKAIYNFEQAVKYNPDYAEAYIALGDIYLKQGNNYRAISQYTTAIEKNPEYPAGHFHLAQAYVNLGMKEAAISELRRTVHLDANHQKARKMLDKLMEE